MNKNDILLVDCFLSATQLLFLIISARKMLWNFSPSFWESVNVSNVRVYLESQCTWLQYYVKIIYFDIFCIITNFYKSIDYLDNTTRNDSHLLITSGFIFITPRTFHNNKKFCCCKRVVGLKKHQKNSSTFSFYPMTALKINQRHDCIVAICNNCFDIIAGEIVCSVANVFLP